MSTWRFHEAFVCGRNWQQSQERNKKELQLFIAFMYIQNVMHKHGIRAKIKYLKQQLHIEKKKKESNTNIMYSGHGGSD